jgi:hypothetical protein
LIFKNLKFKQKQVKSLMIGLTKISLNKSKKQKIKINKKR